MKGKNSGEQFLFHRVTGFIEGQLSILSAAHNLSSVVLTQRVAELLSNPTGRSSEEDYVQPVRENSAFGTQGQRTLEMGRYPQNSIPRSTSARRGPGRPKGVKNKTKAEPLRTPASRPAKKKLVARHIMSPEARKRVAEAQRNRWAKAKKEAEKTGRKVTPQNLHEFMKPPVQETQEVVLTNVS